MTEHTANVETVAISYDGKLMATGAWDGGINLYTFDSMGNPKIKETYKGHMGAVISLNFSANGKYLVSGSKDFSARVWNIDTPTKHKVFNLHLEPVTAAFLDPSYKFLITASLDGNIKTTKLDDAAKTRTLKLSGPIHDLVLSRDRKFYYAALRGGVIKKYETGSKNAELMSFSGHLDDINSIELSPDGNFIASASNDKTIQIWDLNTGKSTKTLNGFEWKVTSLKYSSDGKYIVGGCNNGVTKLFEVASGKNITDFSELGKNVRDVTFSRDGNLIVVATLMDTEKYGVVVYNSGVSAPPLSQPTTNARSKTVTPAANAKPSAKKPNGTK